MRFLSVASVAAVLLISGVAAAQSRASASGRPPITWCGGLAAQDIKWARQRAYLSLIIIPRDTAIMFARVGPHLPLLLDGIARSWAEMRGWAPRSRNDSLPTGEPRYGPGSLRTSVAFDLHGNGHVGAVTVNDSTDSAVSADAVAAVKHAEARGDTFGPIGEDSLRATLQLSLMSLDDETVKQLRSGKVKSDPIALMPLFTIDAPLDQHARSRRGNPPPAYPQTAGELFEVLVVFTFVVDEDGRAVPESIRSVPPDATQWSAGVRVHYQKFVTAVEGVIPRYRFDPAHEGGCRVKEFVQMPFVFMVC